jgi:hypothetical protein
MSLNTPFNRADCQLRSLLWGKTRVLGWSEVGVILISAVKTKENKFRDKLSRYAT